MKFAETIFPPFTSVVPYPEATNITVGDSFYATTRFLPPNTHVTWGVNLGLDNITAAVLETTSIVKFFALSETKRAGIVLDYLEIGNEPDLYRNNGLRPSTYNVTHKIRNLKYIGHRWLTFAHNVSTVANLSSTSHTKFLGASFAGSSRDPGSGGLLSDLMTKSTIRGNLTVFVPDIQAAASQGLKYILGETNSYACHVRLGVTTEQILFDLLHKGAPGVSNTAGAALWTLDYALFATQLGISTVFFHEGVGFKYSLASLTFLEGSWDNELNTISQIQPTTLTRSTLDGSNLPKPAPPHVQPQYYAAIIAGEAIGKTGEAQVLEIDIDHPQVAGYSFYEDAHLVRAIFINSKAYLPGSTNRTNVHLDLGFTTVSDIAPTTMTVKRLAIGYATDVSGLTWGGQTYETSDGRVANSVVIETRPVSDGLDIQETEIILVAFRRDN
ncbi:hypothetical protein C0995_001268 [Termitomyces sp. Mi166|nr:hypothetical protein C0995_001268 [Termitomyces sp. Mi166\